MVESLEEKEIETKESERHLEVAGKEADCDAEKSKHITTSHARSFIAHNSKRRQSEEVGPVPWPMPPRLEDNFAGKELTAKASRRGDADREFLTPLSSFAQIDAENPISIDRLPVKIQNREDSSILSRESTVQTESYSSAGTSFSAVFPDSSDSGSSESVSKVDIDGDEFAHFLSEGTKSSHSAVDFRGLFAAEDRNKPVCEEDDATQVENNFSSDKAEYSTTPKATRAPFRYYDGTKQEKGAVCLTDGLDFSPDYKVIRTDHDPPFHENREASVESGGSRETEKENSSNAIANGHAVESALRRPMASRQKTFIVLPQPRDNVSGAEKGRESSERLLEPKVVGTNEERQFGTHVQKPPPMKGVIMRAQSHVSHVAGIRRAETGRIMSKAELGAEKPILFQESPNPKSLNPAGFQAEEEDALTAHPSTIFVKPTTERNDFIDYVEPFMKDTSERTQKSLSSAVAAKLDDGSFLSPGILSRKKKFGTEEYKVDSFQFSEQDGSSGLLNRFSSGFRKMHMAVAKKSSSNENTQARESAIIVPGSIDEAACKVCVVCRNQLDCEVYVKDAGKKIKVESRKDGLGGYLRTTILVRQIPGQTMRCEVYVQQSRSNGMKTSLVTLWSFYQRLEAGLKDMG